MSYATAVSQSTERREGKIRQSSTFFEALPILGIKKRIFRLEVGLGGGLDATNVAKPEVCVITPISLEHSGILGDNLDKIAHYHKHIECHLSI